MAFENLFSVNFTEAELATIHIYKAYRWASQSNRQKLSINQ